MVGGPAGAIAGGVAGTAVGEQSARGRRPVAKTAETIGDEFRKGTPMKVLKSAAGSLGLSGKKSSNSAKSDRRKKAKPTSKRKVKSAKKGTNRRSKKRGTKKKR
jgi:hypothetical protein